MTNNKYLTQLNMFIENLKKHKRPIRNYFIFINIFGGIFLLQIFKYSIDDYKQQDWVNNKIINYRDFNKKIIIHFLR